MVMRWESVFALNFIIDYLLLLGTNRLCGYPPGWKRDAIAAIIGSIYSTLCLMPKFMFLGTAIWRILLLAIMSVIAFGASVSTVQRGAVFSLLGMAMSGVAVGLNMVGMIALLISVLGILVLCILGSHRGSGGASYVPVELQFGDKKIQATALYDTGNTLKDPVTGRSVLVIGVDIAHQLTGLTVHQLRDPVATASNAPLPGLRLIPFRTIDKSGGMLLGLQMANVRIGKRRGGTLVAFAPEKLSTNGAYQALTGGIV